jgi:hypothetical protein
MRLAAIEAADPGVDVGVDPLAVARQHLEVGVVVAGDADVDAGVRLPARACTA